MGECRSCGAEVIWVETEKGRRMPVDAESTEGGNIVLVDGVAKYVKAGEGTHVSHFVTCPNAKSHRRK